MAQTSTKTRKKAQLPSMVLLFLLGALLGIFAAWEMTPVAQSGAGFGTYLISLVWLVVSLMLSLYLQVILHEAGHMVFGLLTGYRFVSFRIGSRMIQVENGRLCGMVSLGDLAGREETVIDASDALSDISGNLSSR